MRKQTQRVVLATLTFGMLAGSAALGTVLWSIQESVRESCAAAQQEHPHPGDDVAALVVYMNTTTHSLKERNRAVWTLGRLRTPLALEALQDAYDGDPCDHEHHLCQYELEKAISRCGGSLVPEPRSAH